MSKEVRKSSALISLQSLVANVQNDLRDYSSQGRKRLMQFAVRGVTEINLYYLNTVEVVYFNMSDIYTVDLPSDYIDYVAIGININGQLKTLGLNNKILPPRDENCGDVSRDSNELHGVHTSGAYRYADHYCGSNYVTGMYSIGGGFNTAYYRIDKERRQIVFQSEIQRTDGVLEYISTGINMSGKTLIPIQARECLLAWVHWKNIEHDRSYHLSEKDRRQRLYDREVSKLYGFEFSFTIDEYLDAKYQESKQTPKR